MKRIILVMAALCGVAAAQTCGVHTVVGTYVMSYIGWLTVMVPDTPPANYSGGIFGIASIDGAGKVTGTGAIGGMGPVTDYDVSGTITIKPDCTGAIQLTGKPKGSSGPATMTEVDRFVFLPDLGEFRLIVWDLGPGVYPAMLGTWKRIAPVPNYAEW
ncbi:MAG: hypothetical protein ABSE56_08185 [Bryobacteraceae bacterium]|jgi:hypothetical protein